MSAVIAACPSWCRSHPADFPDLHTATVTDGAAALRIAFDPDDDRGPLVSVIAPQGDDYTLDEVVALTAALMKVTALLERARTWDGVS